MAYIIHLYRPYLKSFRLTWHVPDPSGAPVHGARVELRARPMGLAQPNGALRSMFGSWQLIQGHAWSSNGWHQQVYGLEPGQACHESRLPF